MIIQAMPGKRSYGTGELYEKHGSYYGRWRTSDGRKLNRKVGPVRAPGSPEGLTRAKAERAFRYIQEAEERRPSRRRDVEAVTVSAAAVSLQRAKALEGSRKSYLENLDSMLRIHLEPSIGQLPLEKVTTARIEALGSELLASGRSAKTVHNVLTFAYSASRALAGSGTSPVRRMSSPNSPTARLRSVRASCLAEITPEQHRRFGLCADCEAEKAAAEQLPDRPARMAGATVKRRQRIGCDMSELVAVPDFPEAIDTIGGRPVWLLEQCDQWRQARARV